MKGLEDFQKWENETLLKGYFPIKAFVPISWGSKCASLYAGDIIFQDNTALPISHARYKRVKNYLIEI